MSYSAVLVALGKLGLVCERPHNGHAVKGQVPFGWEPANGRLVRNAGDQQVIRLMRQLHAGGVSLNAIASALNRRLEPTKNACCGRSGHPAPVGLPSDLISGRSFPRNVPASETAPLISHGRSLVHSRAIAERIDRQ